MPYHNIHLQDQNTNLSRRLRSTYEPADKENIDD